MRQAKKPMQLKEAISRFATPLYNLILGVEMIRSCKQEWGKMDDRLL